MDTSDSERDNFSSPKSESKFGHSYEDERFARAEEVKVADPKGSPIVWGRQESIFLAESSTSSEDIQTIYTERCETAPLTTANESANTITEEPDFSDEFELVADFSEGDFTVQVRLSELVRIKFKPLSKVWLT